MKEVFLILFLGLLSSCAVQVMTIHDPSVDFASYQRFCWLKGCDYRIDAPDYLDPEVVKVLGSAIENTLIEKGYVKDDVDPDFMVDFHVVVDEIETHFNQPFDHDEEIEFFYGPQRLTYTFLEGSIVIDLVDQKMSQMVWRTDIKQYLDMNKEVRTEDLQKAVEKAFRKFPPTSVR